MSLIATKVSYTWKRKIRELYLYSDHIGYTIFPRLIIRRSAVSSIFSRIFSHILSRNKYAAGDNLAESVPEIKFRKESPTSRAIAARNRDNGASRSAFAPDNYESHLITFPRLRFRRDFYRPRNRAGSHP